jgi:hypothetical protein
MHEWVESLRDGIDLFFPFSQAYKERRRVSVGRLGVWWTKLTGRQPQTCQVQTDGYPPPPNTLLSFFFLLDSGATLTWSRPPREREKRVSHATCVPLPLPPHHLFFILGGKKLEGFYLIRLPFDFNYWSTTRIESELIRFVSSSFPPASRETSHTPSWAEKKKIIDSLAQQTKHTPTAHYY